MIFKNVNVAKPGWMSGFCIHVGLLPVFLLSTGPGSQTTVCVVRLLPLGTESQLGRQSGCGTGRVEPHVLLTAHQRAVPRARTQGLGS